MSIKVKDVISIMEKYAPSEFKVDYDNVGLMVGDKNEEVENVLISLDCKLEVIEEAKEKKCNLILTHHPLLFIKPKTITTDTLTGRKIIELIKNNINVFSSHTNLDAVQGGLNDIITEIMGYESQEIIEPMDSKIDTKVGIGRIVILKQSITLKQLCDSVKNSLKIPMLKYSGCDEKEIQRIAIINGSGEDLFGQCRSMKVDCIITGDTKYHYVSDLEEEGVAIIDAGHYETEWPAFKEFSKKLKQELNTMGFKGEVIISQCNTGTYKYR